MQFQCARCQSRYRIGDDKAEGRVLKIRCKNCGASIVLRGPGAPPSEAVSNTPDQAAPARTVSVTSLRIARAIDPALAPAIAIWHVAVDRERRGPISAIEVERLIHDGSLNPRSYVWRAGMASWAFLETIMEFQTALREREGQSARTIMSEAPVAEAPVAEAPVAEAPVAEAPVPEAPPALLDAPAASHEASPAPPVVFDALSTPVAAPSAQPVPRAAAMTMELSAIDLADLADVGHATDFVVPRSLAVAPVESPQPEPGPVAPLPPAPPPEPAPVALPEPEPVALPEPEPVALPEPEPVALPEPEPVALPEPEPTIAAPLSLSAVAADEDELERLTRPSSDVALAAAATPSEDEPLLDDGELTVQMAAPSLQDLDAGTRTAFADRVPDLEAADDTEATRMAGAVAGAAAADAALAEPPAAELATVASAVDDVSSQLSVEPQNAGPATADTATAGPSTVDTATVAAPSPESPLATAPPRFDASADDEQAPTIEIRSPSVATDAAITAAAPSDTEPPAWAKQLGHLASLVASGDSLSVGIPEKAAWPPHAPPPLPLPKARPATLAPPEAATAQAATAQAATAQAATAQAATVLPSRPPPTSAPPSAVAKPPSPTDDDTHSLAFFEAGELQRREEIAEVLAEVEEPDVLFPDSQGPRRSMTQPRMITIPVIQLEERPPTPAEMKGLVQDFSLMIRLEKKKRTNTAVVAGGLVLLGVVIAVVAYVALKAQIEPDKGTDRLTVMQTSSNADELIGALHRSDGQGEPTNNGPTRPVAVTHHDSTAVDLAAVLADNKAAAEARAAKEADETLTITIPDPKKPGGGSARPSGPGPSGNGVPPIQAHADHVKEALKAPDQVGKIEQPLALPSLAGPTTRPTVTDPAVNELIQRSVKRFTSCKRAENPIRVRLTFTVAETGEVGSSTVSLPDGEADLGLSACIRKLVSSWKFPQGDKPQTFNKTIVL